MVSIDTLAATGAFGTLWGSVSRRPMRSSDPFQTAAAFQQGAIENAANAKAIAKERAQMVAVARSIQEAARPLTMPGPGNVFLKSAVETTSNAVTGTASVGANLGHYDVAVNQLAKGQILVSDAVDAAAPTTIAPGLNRIDIAQGGATRHVQFTVNAGDTNAQVADKIAAAVNGTPDLGVKATVAKPVTGKVRLDLAAKATGSASAFTAADSLGNAAMTLHLMNTGPANPSAGAGGVLQAAQNAEVVVEGQSVSLAQNRLVLDGGRVTLNFHAVTAAVGVDVVPDGEAIASAVSAFADAVNGGRTALGKMSAPAASQSLGRIDQAVSQRRATLSQVGIGVSASGALQVDEGVLAQSVKDDFVGVVGAVAGPFGVARAVAQEAASLESKAMSLSVPGLDQRGLARAARLQQQGLFLNLLA